MNLAVLKVGFAVAVLAIGLTGALLPWFLRAYTPNERYLAWGDAFAGGVLGGAGLIHLLSGGMKEFKTLAPGQQYPFALLLAGAGFLFVLLIEGVIAADREGMESRAVPQHACVSRPMRPGEYPEKHKAFAFVLLLVLSIHSVILGLTLGAQSSLIGALAVFIAIVAHKGVAGFALGVGYQRAGYSRGRAIPAVAFFAGMTPLGILMGEGVSAVISSRGGMLFEAIFDSIGAGTFLYIASIDIIRTEFDAPLDRLQKWISACLGFGIMALLAVWI